jgi:cytosine/adenosine deaminase-related metal-dependent hydrolase
VPVQPSPTRTTTTRLPSDGDWLLSGAVDLDDGSGVPVAGPVHLSVRHGVVSEVRPAGGSFADAGGGLVLLPLLVNAHDHGRGAGNVLAGIADAPLEPWIASLRTGPGILPPTQTSLVGDACRMMLRSGVGATVICPNPQHPDTAAEVAEAAAAATTCGIRAAIVYPFADCMGDLYGRTRQAPGWSPSEVRRHLRAVEDLAGSVDDPGIEIQLGPVGPQWVSESTLEAVAAHAADTGRRVHMHLLESRAQRAWADRTYPEGLLDFLDRIGLLGPHVCFAHGTNLRPEELAGLAAAGAVVSFNASSNLRLASGIPPLAAGLDAPLAVGAGLDGLSLGDDADYFTELRLVRGLTQAQSGRTAAAGDLLDRLASGGGLALGAAAPTRPGVGRPADFVLLDLDGYGHLVDQAGWSPADVALAAGRPDRVREVWVSGRQVHADVSPGSDARLVSTVPSAPTVDHPSQP